MSEKKKDETANRQRPEQTGGPPLREVFFNVSVKPDGALMVLFFVIGFYVGLLYARVLLRA